MHVRGDENFALVNTLVSSKELEVSRKERAGISAHWIKEKKGGKKSGRMFDLRQRKDFCSDGFSSRREPSGY